MGTVIEMASKFMIKRLIDKKLTGREVASLFLSDFIQECQGLPSTFSAAEKQSAYNSLIGRPEEHPAFSKWMRVEDVIFVTRAMADFHAMSASHHLTLIRSKMTLFKMQWLVKECEEEWQGLLDQKGRELENHGCSAHLISIFNPLPPQASLEKQSREIDFIKTFYGSAKRHLRLYSASKAIREVLCSILKIKKVDIKTTADETLESTILLFNRDAEAQTFSEYLAQEHPGIVPILPKNLISPIDMETYLPSRELLEKVKSRLEDAPREKILETCAQVVDEITNNLFHTKAM